MNKVLIFFLSSSILLGCKGITGSGNIVKQSRNVSGFTGLSVGQSIDVTVRIGNSQMLQVQADDNILDNIVTTVKNGILEISYGDYASINNGNVKVLIEVPYLNFIKVSSSAEVNVDGTIRYDGEVKLEASSSGEISGNFEIGEVVAEATSSASINLKGSARNGEFSASSSGEINAIDLECETATAAASSSGSISVNVHKDLKASASSSGDIIYKGAANVSKNVSSSGSIEKQ